MFQLQVPVLQQDRIKWNKKYYIISHTVNLNLLFLNWKIWIRNFNHRPHPAYILALFWGLNYTPSILINRYADTFIYSAHTNRWLNCFIKYPSVKNKINNHSFIEKKRILNHVTYFHGSVFLFLLIILSVYPVLALMICCTDECLKIRDKYNLFTAGVQLIRPLRAQKISFRLSKRASQSHITAVPVETGQSFYTQSIPSIQ